MLVDNNEIQSFIANSSVLTNLQEITYEQQRTWLRLHTNPLDLWSLAYLQESQFP